MPISQVLPKPVLSTIPLCIPVVSNPATTSHEEKYIRHKLELDQLIRFEGLDGKDRSQRRVGTPTRDALLCPAHGPPLTLLIPCSDPVPRAEGHGPQAD